MLKGLIKSLIKAVKDLTKAFVTFWETLASRITAQSATVIVYVITINLMVLTMFFAALIAVVVFVKLFG